MASTLKFIKWTILGVTGLFLALVLFLFFWIDPNDYRDDISKAVKDNTGLVLVIGGNIGWNFYPAIGFSVEQLSLATAEDAAPLATVKKAAVSVELLPLFSKQVNVRTLFIDGLAADLVVDANGKGNWEALSAGGEAPAEPEPAPAQGGGDLVVNVPQVVVTNTFVEYRDQKAGTHYSVNVKELVADDIGLAREFPLKLVAALDDNKGLAVGIDSRMFLRLDPAAESYGVRALDLKADVSGILPKSFKVEVLADLTADMKAQKVAATRLSVNARELALGGPATMASVEGPLLMDLGADTATVGPLKFSLAMLAGTLALDVKDVTKKDPAKELSFTGPLTVSAFNAKQLMRELGIAPPQTTDPSALTAVSLQATIDGALTRAALNDLVIKLDDTTIKGNAGITDVATKALAFDLTIDALNADRYLPPPAKPAADGKAAAPVPAAKPAGGKAAPLLPVATLRTLNVDGSLKAGKVTFMEWPMTSLAVGVKAKDGLVRVDPVSAGVLEGTISGDVTVDARPDVPRITTHLKLDKVEVGGIVKRYAGRDLFTGKTSLKLDLDTAGNDVDALLKAAVGAVDFSFADSTLKGMNLNNLLTETLTQQLGAFSMLVPDYQQKLPKELQQDTAFSTLAAGAKLKDGIAQVPAFNAAVKDGGVKGSGQFNLVTLDFDYTVAMRTTKLDDSKYFKGTEFPLRCKGNVTGSPADWCRPDTKAIGDMLKKAAGNAAKDRLKGELAEKLGVESVDSKALKAEVDQQLEAEKKAAEKKAKEKVNKELERALNKFF